MKAIVDQEQRALVGDALRFIRDYRAKHKLALPESGKSFACVVIDDLGVKWAFQLNEGHKAHAMDAAAFFAQAPYALRKAKRAIGFSLSVTEGEIPPPCLEELAPMIADLEMLGIKPAHIAPHFEEASRLPGNMITRPDLELFANCRTWVPTICAFARACLVMCYRKSQGEQ